MRYRHTWPGLLLLASLVVSLVGLAGWGDHFLSPGPNGGLSRLLEVRSPFRASDEAVRRPSSRAADRVTLSESAVEPLAPPDEPPQPPTGPGSSPESSGRTSPVEDRPRYALDLGTFRLVDEVERAEAQLNQAGFSTVRFRRQDPGRLFSVSLPQPLDPAEARALIDRLREDGFIEVEAINGIHPEIRLAAAMPLRTAVRIAERLRGAGHDPRVAAEALRSGQLALRHGHFTSRGEAEAVRIEIGRYGVTAEVVQVP